MNNQQMSGRDFHKRAERAREHGSFTESLNFCELAFEIYAREGNGAGMSEVCASMFLSLRHLSEKYDNDINYLIRAKYIAKAGVAIANDSGNLEAISIPIYNLGQAYFALKNYKKAAKFYKEAIKTLPDSPHNSTALLLNMKIHLELALFKEGDKKAIERALKALAELESIDVKSYEKDVWVSGGYLKLAEAIHKNDKKKSSELLKKAKEIIDNNEELKLRKIQLQKIQKNLK